mmetsp:Transcript_6227/g.13300  ORF Transcript_6227/g.13300 Transcript_6227/m.13300 type:complete len:224 (+) Transcript_6227:90-761(+)
MGERGLREIVYDIAHESKQLLLGNGAVCRWTQTRSFCVHRAEDLGIKLLKEPCGALRIAFPVAENNASNTERALAEVGTTVPFRRLHARGHYDGDLGDFRYEFGPTLFEPSMQDDAQRQVEFVRLENFLIFVLLLDTCLWFSLVLSLLLSSSSLSVWGSMVLLNAATDILMLSQPRRDTRPALSFLLAVLFPTVSLTCRSSSLVYAFPRLLALFMIPIMLDTL